MVNIILKMVEPSDYFQDEIPPVINVWKVIHTQVSGPTVEEQTRKNSNFPVRGIFKNPREIIVNIFR
jgi:hypothetical protein